MPTIDAFPELFASKHPGDNYLKGITDNGREGILPLTYDQLATTCASNIFLLNFLLNKYLLFRIGAVKIDSIYGHKSWLILVPEQVGEIDSSEVKEWEN